MWAEVWGVEREQGTLSASWRGTGHQRVSWNEMKQDGSFYRELEVGDVLPLILGGQVVEVDLHAFAGDQNLGHSYYHPRRGHQVVHSS